MLANQSLVSIVVVTFNSAQTVIDTLNSIYNQTYNDIELIISDDGSRDKTIAVCREWLEAKSNRFFRAIINEHSNTGVALNCNRGVRLANGGYIQVIAGDDVLRESAIETKLHYALEKNLDMVFCQVNPFGNDEQKVDKMRNFCERGYNIIKAGYETQKRNILVDNYIAGPSGGFFTKVFFDSMGGYDERYPMLEDYPFIYHYIYAGRSVYLIEEVLADYRISSGSLCMKKASPMVKSQCAFFFYERLFQMIREKRVGLAFRQTFRFVRRWLVS